MSGWLLVLALVLAGCGGEPAGGPPEIQYGLEECGHCRMIISEEKFAAASVDASDTVTRFDDLGCMVEYLGQQPTPPRRVWVHDHATGDWIAGETAWFVRDPRGATPMASGLVAFASWPDAETHGVDVRDLASLLEDVAPLRGAGSLNATYP